MRSGGKFWDINRDEKRRAEHKEGVSKLVSTYNSILRELACSFLKESLVSFYVVAITFSRIVITIL